MILENYLENFYWNRYFTKNKIMDLEKAKKDYNWDPMKGDYTKSYISYERRMLRRKQIRNRLLILLYIILLIASIIIVYRSI
jgi:hypothetical protein